MAIDKMTSRERMDALWRGEEIDRPPFSVWRHFPQEDQSAQGLADATSIFQTQVGCDFVKFMPPGDYPIIDWGGSSEYRDSPAGVRVTTRFPVVNAIDWTHLTDLDVEQGFNGVMLDALALARRLIDPSVPILQTVFSPLTIAMKLSDGQVLVHLQSDPAQVHSALSLIASVTRKMLAASLNRGADGIFFATQCADHSVMTIEQYREFGLKYDLIVLDPFSTGSKLLLHLHGAKPMLQLASDYPYAALNWHDRHAGPDLAAGKTVALGPVAGGINELAIADASPAAINSEAHDALGNTSGKGVIITPGCVVPLATPVANLLAVRDAVIDFAGTRS